MSHAPAWWCGDTGDEADNGFSVGSAVVLHEVGGCLLFSAATNFTNQQDSLALLVGEEHLEAVDEVGAVEGVAADANAQPLAQADSGGLVNSLVR